MDLVGELDHKTRCLIAWPMNIHASIFNGLELPRFLSSLWQLVLNLKKLSVFVRPAFALTSGHSSCSLPPCHLGCLWYHILRWQQVGGIFIMLGIFWPFLEVPFKFFQVFRGPPRFRPPLRILGAARRRHLPRHDTKNFSRPVLSTVHYPSDTGAWKDEEQRSR